MERRRASKRSGIHESGESEERPNSNNKARPSDKASTRAERVKPVPSGIACNQEWNNHQSLTLTTHVDLMIDKIK